LKVSAAASCSAARWAVFFSQFAILAGLRGTLAPWRGWIIFSSSSMRLRFHLALTLLADRPTMLV
jgi:hypothetical protein